MRFAAAADLLAEMGMSPLPDYIAAATSALDTATLVMQNDLRDEFDACQRTDIFRPFPNEVLERLKLRQGFVVKGSVQVLYSLSPAGFHGGGTVIDLTRACEIDLHKGVVWVAGLPERLEAGYYTQGYPAGYYGLGGAELRVRYAAGFDPSDNDPDLYDTTQTPDWLVRLAKIRARLTLANHPAIQVSGVTHDDKYLSEQYIAVVAKKARYVPGTILPR